MISLWDKLDELMSQSIEEKKRPVRMIGLCNIVTNKKEWKYLILYEVDTPSEGDQRLLIEALDCMNTSFIIYTTKRGLHAVGLTPMTIGKYSLAFSRLQRDIPEYYSGQTIRLSRKIGEQQKLVYYDIEHPTIPNLLEIYSKRFFNDNLNTDFNETIQKHLIRDEHWSLVFEKYWTLKP